MTSGELDRRVEWSEGLHDYFAFDIAAARTPGNLRQQLKRPLTGAEIGLMQRQVRVDDSHQRHIGEVQPFGDHLRSQEDVDLAGPEIAKDPSIIIFALESVGIHPCGPGVWEQFP